MYSVELLGKTFMLALAALGNIRPISAFVPPPAAHERSRGISPLQEQQQQCTPLSFQPSSRAECGLLQCTSSAAASSDPARDEEPWPVELSTESYLTSYPNQRRTALSSAASSERKAFVFTAKPLPEGATLRGMEQSDVDGVVGLAFEEYYEGPTEFSSGVHEGFGVLKSTWRRAVQRGVVEEADVEQLTDWLEMIWLRVMIRWGFSMRIQIGKYGQDHRVFCVSDEERKSSKLPLAAVAEISLQVPNGRTATPFPLPLWVKRLKAWPGPVLPYISNVLVHPHVRRQGLANRLMLRCEEQARDWGYTQVYLHVDLTYYPAVRMYETMGYEMVNDLEVSFETPRLRYMKKIL
ncbi:unnamed protein product [Pylaiella littoralis]